MRARGSWFVLSLLSALALGFNLNAGSLLSSDDALYVQMAREMVGSGRWLAPTWMGEIVFEKPPLLLWLLGLSGWLFGWGEGAMRLPGVLGGCLALWFTARLSMLAVPRDEEAPSPWPAVVACALCLSTVAFVFNVRRPMTDPLLVAFAMMSLWACSQVLTGAGGRRAEWLLGLGLGLGILSKSVAMGPVALVICVSLAMARLFGPLGRSLGITALVSVPWHLWMLLSHGRTFLDTYFGYHVLGRAVRSLVGETGPWTYVELASQEDPALSLVLLLGLVFGSLAALRAAPRSPQRAVLALCASSAWLTAIVIQLASTRLFHYLLPIIPMVAVLTAAVVVSSPARRLLSGCVLALCALGFVSGPLEHLLRPDYSPSSRAIAERHLVDLPRETRLILWESYDPALFWYAQRPGEIWSDDSGFLELQRSVDMIRRSGVVSGASEQGFRSLMEGGEGVIVIPEHRQHTLAPWLYRLGLVEKMKPLYEPDLGHVLLFVGRDP